MSRSKVSFAARNCIRSRANSEREINRRHEFRINFCLPTTCTLFLFLSPFPPVVRTSLFPYTIRHVVKCCIFAARKINRAARRKRCTATLSHVSLPLDETLGIGQESVKRYINHESFCGRRSTLQGFPRTCRRARVIFTNKRYESCTRLWPARIYAPPS